MKNLQKNKQKKEKIIKLVKIWQDRLGLVNWEISCRFQAIKYPKETEDYVGVAHVITNTEYKLATITFRPDKLALADDATICHELLHCMLGELVGYYKANIDDKAHDKVEQWGSYYQEQLISELERVIMRMYKMPS